MTHPEELLADYVDGALGEPERARIDAHLAACELCREEVRLSRAALTTLASVEDEPVPFGVTGPVLAEAGRRFERRRALVWERLQWAAGLAAAAALVTVVVLSAGRGGDADLQAGGGRAGAEAPPAPEAALGAAIPSLERQRDVRYDDAGLDSLARQAAERTATGDNAGEESAPASVLDCLRTSGAPVDEPADVLVRLVEARYLDTSAYLAVFLEGPGAGQPPSHAVVWVAAVDDCRFLSAASRRI